MMLLKYRVLQPFEPYTLTLKAGTIEGWAAVLFLPDTRRVKGRAVVLSPEVRQARDKRIPDYVALARYVAMSNELDYTDIALMHFPMLFGEPWSHPEVNSCMAERWLNSILEKAALSPIPIPGPWCRTCSHPCRAVAHIPESPLFRLDPSLR